MERLWSGTYAQEQVQINNLVHGKAKSTEANLTVTFLKTLF